MAQAKKLIPDNPDIQLVLSNREAVVLQDVLMSVAGDPSNSARSRTQAVLSALDGALGRRKARIERVEGDKALGCVHYAEGTR
jgi:hypothetical protein